MQQKALKMLVWEGEGEGEQEEDSRLTLLRVVVEVHAWEEEVVGEEGEGEG